MVKVRFAPSPTGYLHVGGARTALYNYLFAKSNGGTFLLRIEDTDRSRFVESSVPDIMNSLKWLGLHWDEGPVFQSERAEIYRKYAQKLLDEGRAYKCFCSAERLAKLREQQRAMGIKPGYDRHCRDLTPEQIKALNDKKFVVRLKVPLEGQTSFTDALHGKIKVQNAELEDLILLKSDGLPTYHLANVVDDHLMGITHVMRADEWIPSTPYHILLYQFFGWEPPVFVHLPVILAPDGKGKLSKRHGATSVLEFRKLGILPDALLNFLALLGWSPGEDREIVSLPEMVRLFNLKKVGKRGSIFDFNKLYWMNSVYIKGKSDDELFALSLPFFKDYGLIKSETDEAMLKRIIPLFKTRIRTLSEFPPFADYFFREDFTVEEKGVNKHFKDTAVFDTLLNVKNQIERAPKFDAQTIEDIIRQTAEHTGVKAAKLIHPIRIALTGKTVGPGLFELMEVLGKDIVLARLANARERIRL